MQFPPGKEHPLTSSPVLRFGIFLLLLALLRQSLISKVKVKVKVQSQSQSSKNFDFDFEHFEL